MATLIQVEEIEQLLNQLPRIVALRDQAPTAFVARTTIWMDLLEQALIAAHADSAARVAGLRGGLIAGSGAAGSGPDAVTAAIDEAVAIARAVIDEFRPRFADAERRIIHLVKRARSEHALPSDETLARVRRSLRLRVDLEREYAVVEGLVGEEDALLLLGRSLRQGLGPPAAARR